MRESEQSLFPLHGEAGGMLDGAEGAVGFATEKVIDHTANDERVQDLRNVSGVYNINSSRSSSSFRTDYGIDTP